MNGGNVSTFYMKIPRNVEKSYHTGLLLDLVDVSDTLLSTTSWVQFISKRRNRVDRCFAELIFRLITNSQRWRVLWRVGLWASPELDVLMRSYRTVDKNVTKMWQQEGILSVQKYFFRRKISWNFVTPCCYHWKSTKLVVSINSHILLCMSWCYTSEKSSRSVQWLFAKTLRTKGRYGQKTRSWTKF